MKSVKALQTKVWTYYKTHGRDLPWRNTTDPYHILVSEIMLQQTQVPRVLIKYEEFLKKFPTIQKLASANTKDLITTWKGLGYNRRALNLKRTAEIVVGKHDGKIPSQYEKLIELPGIGPATAGDLLAFAWNMPAVVIETNIRSVFIHHFFNDKKSVHDKDLLPLIEKSLDEKNPREWYYALMDYGSMLKKTVGNTSKKSVHYTTQSRFEGSNRQLRANIVAYIAEKPRTELSINKMFQKQRLQTRNALIKRFSKKSNGKTTAITLRVDKKDTNISQNLVNLSKEGFIEKRGKTWYIQGS